LLHYRPEKERRIKHLRFDAELVHMSEPRLDAEHLPRFLRCVGADIAVFAVRSAFDHPKVTHGASFVTEKVRPESLRHQLRRETSLIWFQITPSLHRLDHMSVSVNRSHRFPPW
jgi:hypothetical protein